MAAQQVRLMRSCGTAASNCPSTLSELPLLQLLSGGGEGPKRFEFDNALQGNDIPPEFHSAIEKGFVEAANSGSLIGAPVEVRKGGCFCWLETHSYWYMAAGTVF